MTQTSLDLVNETVVFGTFCSFVVINESKVLGVPQKSCDNSLAQGCAGGSDESRRPERLPEPLLGHRKGTNGVSTNRVTANFMFVERVVFGVFPLTYFYVPKSASA